MPILLRWQGCLQRVDSGPLGRQLTLIAGLVLCALMVGLPLVTRSGLSLLVLWVGALQLMLDKGKELDWFHSAQIVTLAVVPSANCWCNVMRPAVQITTSSPLGCISQLSQLSEKRYIVTSRPSAPSASWRSPYP